MMIVPVIKSSDLRRSLRFYTEILDFERKWPGLKTARWPTESLTSFETWLNYSFHVIQETVPSAP